MKERAPIVELALETEYSDASLEKSRKVSAEQMKKIISVLGQEILETKMAMC